MEFIGIDPDGVIATYLMMAFKIALLIVGFIVLSPIGKKVLSSTLQKAGQKQKISVQRCKTLEKLLVNMYFYVLVFLFVMMLFGILEIPIAPLLAGAGVVGLAIGFGAQGLVSDVVTGFFLLLERQIEVDEYVTTAGFSGIVEEVGLRTTKVRSFDGTLNFIPNREIISVSNHSRGNMQALVDIGISYNDNIDEALAVLQKVCEDFKLNDERFTEGPDAVGVQSLGSSEVVLRVIGQTVNMEQWAAQRDMLKRIKEAFDAAGIEIPYPHQVLIEKKSN